MIYEQRLYQATPGKLPELLARFRNHTLKIWSATASGRLDSSPR